MLAAVRLELALVDRLVPDAAVELGDQIERRAGAHDAAGRNDRHPLAQIRDVLDDVRRQDHDDVLADLGEQVEEAVALLRIEAGGRLVDDDQLGLPISACAMPNRWRMPPENPASALLRTSQRLTCCSSVSTVSRRSRAPAMPLSTAM